MAVKPDPALVAKFMTAVPHMKATGISVEDFSKGKVSMRLPFDERFVGYPDTGVLAGGIIFTLMDSAAGAAVFSALPQLRPVATLDLRLDYLKPATPGQDVFAHTECYRLTHHIAFVRGVACHEDADDPIAHATGTFMITHPEKKPAKDQPGA